MLEPLECGKSLVINGRELDREASRGRQGTVHGDACPGLLKPLDFLVLRGSIRGKGGWGHGGKNEEGMK